MMNLFQLRMIIVLMINKIICEEYKEYENDFEELKWVRIREVVIQFWIQGQIRQ